MRRKPTVLYIIAGVFLLFAALMYAFSWIGNHFVLEHGKTETTVADLNRYLVGDTIIIGIPLFIAGMAIGYGFHKRNNS